MCFRTKCGSCGLASWAGCGMHIQSALRGVPEQQRCQCRSMGSQKPIKKEPQILPVIYRPETPKKRFDILDKLKEEDLQRPAAPVNSHFRIRMQNTPQKHLQKKINISPRRDMKSYNAKLIRNRRIEELFNYKQSKGPITQKYY